MYTRKTYYPRKFKRSLNGVKFNQVATKITRAEISRIAKKAVEKSSELKRNYQSYIQTLVNNVAYVTNVTAALNQGVTNNEIIGTEFHLKRIRFRVRIIWMRQLVRGVDSIVLCYLKVPMKLLLVLHLLHR